MRRKCIIEEEEVQYSWQEAQDKLQRIIHKGENLPKQKTKDETPRKLRFLSPNTKTKTPTNMLLMNTPLAATLHHIHVYS